MDTDITGNRPKRFSFINKWSKLSTKICISLVITCV